MQNVRRRREGRLLQAPRRGGNGLVMHYRALFTSSEFLTSADLYDEKNDTFREMVVTIDRIARVTMVGRKGKKDGRPGAWFKESRSGKPLGLNATNCAAIANVTGSTDMKKWLGARITLRVEMVDIRGEGIRPAVRVVPFRPEQQQAARGSQGEAPAPAPLDEEDELDKAADAWPKDAPR